MSILSADVIGYPGPVDKPHPVDQGTHSTWRALGINVPPTVMREARENHEMMLHRILTNIARKLETLEKATIANSLAMANKDSVDAQFAVRAPASSCLPAARARRAARERGAPAALRDGPCGRHRRR